MHDHSRSEGVGRSDAKNRSEGVGRPDVKNKSEGVGRSDAINLFCRETWTAVLKKKN